MYSILNQINKAMTSEQIRQERRLKNLSQTELAKRAGVHLLTVFRAEKGKVKDKSLEKIVKALQENQQENQ
jgi:transcriptional regulator with XRE-family HTH domain